MQTLCQSSLLYALGYAIAHSIWQSFIVWMVYISVIKILSLTSSAKYRLAVAAQFMGFAWFLFTFRFYYQQYSGNISSDIFTSQILQQILPIPRDFSSYLIQWMIKGELLLPYLSITYLLSILVLLARWVLGYRQTLQIRKEGLQKIPANWRLFVKKIAVQLSIKKEIRIFLSSKISTPLTIGFLKPIILIPLASINHLSTEQLEAVLLHELAHIKRYDYLLNIILSLIEMSLFFNPFIQLIRKHIHTERENSCDDWVLQFQYNVTAYAEALLQIAYLQKTPVFAMAVSGKKNNDLLLRVKRIISKKENCFSYRKQLVAFLMITILISSIVWLKPIPKYSNHHSIVSTNKIYKTPYKSYAIEPMAISVDNPLFNPVFFLSKSLKEEMKRDIASAQKEIDETSILSPGATTEIVTSIPPLVEDALKVAATELTSQKKDFEKVIAQIDQAKIEMERNLLIDTPINHAKLASQIKQSFAKEIKRMEADLIKAKAEMEVVAKANIDMSYEKDKVFKDIQKAMEEIGKIGLDKIVTDALKVTEKVFENIDIQPARSKQSKKILKEKQQLKIETPEKIVVQSPKNEVVNIEIPEIPELTEDIEVPMYKPISGKMNTPLSQEQIYLIKAKLIELLAQKRWSILFNQDQQLIRTIPVRKKESANNTHNTIIDIEFQ